VATTFTPYQELPDNKKPVRARQAKVPTFENKARKNNVPVPTLDTAQDDDRINRKMVNHRRKIGFQPVFA
jgi:hypothetical protein